jgi:hypothetical protein
MLLLRAHIRCRAPCIIVTVCNVWPVCTLCNSGAQLLHGMDGKRDSKALWACGDEDAR